MWWTLLAACAPSPVELDDGSLPTSGCDPSEDLAAAEAATERYADVELAVADGYLPQPGCDEDDEGAAMGLHYVRVAESLDQQIDLLAPDILLYVPQGDGVRLVGIEYVVPALLDGELWAEDTEPVEGSWADPPELFCRPFDGPMPGHVLLQPWHYDLHVWLHSDNADGTFAPYNPAEGCDG